LKKFIFFLLLISTTAFSEIIRLECDPEQLSYLDITNCNEYLKSDFQKNFCNKNLSIEIDNKNEPKKIYYLSEDWGFEDKSFDTSKSDDDFLFFEKKIKNYATGNEKITIKIDRYNLNLIFTRQFLDLKDDKDWVEYYNCQIIEKKI